MLPERAIPAERVLVVRVDEGSVDVEDRGRDATELAKQPPLFAACCLVAAFGELLDQLLVEGRNVVRLAARDEPAGRRRLLGRRSCRRRCGGRSGATAMTSACGRARRRPRSSSQGAWQIAATGLPCSKNSWTNWTAFSSDAQRVRVANAAGQHERVVVGSADLLDSLVDLEGVSLVVVVEPLNLAILDRHDRELRTRPSRAPPKALVNSTCSNHVSREKRNLLPLQLVSHQNLLGRGFGLGFPIRRRTNARVPASRRSTPALTETAANHHGRAQPGRICRGECAWEDSNLRPAA